MVPRRGIAPKKWRKKYLEIWNVIKLVLLPAEEEEGRREIFEEEGRRRVMCF